MNSTPVEKFPRPVGISVATQQRIALKLGLDKNAKLGPIANAAKVRWPALFPEVSQPSIRPEGTNLAILDFLAFLDPNRTNSGEIPPEIEELKRALNKE